MSFATRRKKIMWALSQSSMKLVQWIHLVVIVGLLTVCAWPMRLLSKYKLYLVYLFVTSLWVVLGNCPLTIEKTESVKEYKVGFVTKMARKLKSDVHPQTVDTIVTFTYVFLVTIVAFRFDTRASHVSKHTQYA